MTPAIAVLLVVGVPLLVGLSKLQVAELLLVGSLSAALFFWLMRRMGVIR